MRFERFRGAGELAAIRDDWRAVIAAIARPHYFQAFEWYDSYVRAFVADPATLRTFVAYQDGRPIAIFPLARQRTKLAGLPLLALTIPANPHAQYSDFVVADSASTSGLPAAFIDHLRRGGAGERWDVVVLSNALQESATWSSFAGARPRMMLDEPADDCDYLDCSSPDRLFDGLSKNFRAVLRKARNKLAKSEGVEWISARRPEEVEAAFGEFLAVEASGWKAARGSAIRDGEGPTRFYTGLARSLAPADAVEINLLKVGGACIAGQFCIRIGRALTILKIGYDERHAPLAPGNLLLEHTLQRAAADQALDVVNLASDAAWHQSWKADRFHGVRIVLFNYRTPLGWASYLALRAKDRLRPLYRKYVKPHVVDSAPSSPATSDSAGPGSAPPT